VKYSSDGDTRPQNKKWIGEWKGGGGTSKSQREMFTKINDHSKVNSAVCACAMVACKSFSL
jgi:hypothetical protein